MAARSLITKTITNVMDRPDGSKILSAQPDYFHLPRTISLVQRNLPAPLPRPFVRQLVIRFFTQPQAQKAVGGEL